MNRQKKQAGVNSTKNQDVNIIDGAQMSFRNPSRQELTLIRRALDNWCVFDFFAGKRLILKDDFKGTSRRTKVCVVSEGLYSLLLPFIGLRNVANTKIPTSVGLAIGEMGKQFTPTLEGADLFARVATRKNSVPFPYIVVNDTAEKLVLYGRDVMGESILSESSKNSGIELLKENQLVILLNSSSQAIGIGRTRYSGKLLRNRMISIKTLRDAGRYLREEDPYGTRELGD